MDIGIVGLGKMGYNLALNLVQKEHNVVAYDINADIVEQIREEGILGVNSIKELVQKLPERKIIWLMIPSGEIVDHTLDELLLNISPKDIIIDGGNSNYKDSVRRHGVLKEKGIEFLDCGTSGGISGALEGVCTMIGGDEETFKYCEELFRDISVENGYLYTGKSGSGHFVKMIHNGIEYGMMQSIAEGFEILEKCQYDIDYEKVARVWNHGSVIRGWLMELTESAFSKDQKLEAIKGIMYSSGEGKWTVENSLDLEVASPVIALSVMMRYRSLYEDTFSGKVVAALRNEFGGHEVDNH